MGQNTSSYFTLIYHRKLKTQIEEKQLCLSVLLPSSSSFSPFSLALASEYLLKIPHTYTTAVRIRQLIQGTALTSPISKPFCPLSLLPTPPTPADFRTTPSGNLRTGSADFSLALAASRLNFAVAVLPFP